MGYGLPYITTHYPLLLYFTDNYRNFPKNSVTIFFKNMLYFLIELENYVSFKIYITLRIPSREKAHRFSRVFFQFY